ncbi:hypothetical protein FZO89_04895 [Luteimonas viscosa]|uniref:Uncharacterized protein n=1 Tax=Luteimonas viscosa TaxID=1132694 RepID=A0A5D4XLX4_9GAMM|nr:hypothetical protein [Luteimonas viscosa]TYT25646.1 hypothetical protein FZO89_04895 [Luteimonas viscosa]
MKLDRLQREILAEMGYTVYAANGDDAATVAAATVASAAPPGPRAAAPCASGPDSLLLALLRAAGRDLDDAQALALCRDLLPPEGLRDARSRRALWPRLRGLRARTAR